MLEDMFDFLDDTVEMYKGEGFDDEILLGMLAGAFFDYDAVAAQEVFTKWQERE